MITAFVNLGICSRQRRAASEYDKQSSAIKKKEIVVKRELESGMLRHEYNGASSNDLPQLSPQSRSSAAFCRRLTEAHLDARSLILGRHSWRYVPTSMILKAPALRYL